MPDLHNEGTPVDTAWSRPRTNKRLIAAELAVCLVLSGAFIGYVLWDLPVGGQSEAAPPAPVRATPDSEVSPARAEQDPAAALASREATITEAQVVSAHIATLTAMRSEFSSTLGALKKKAKSSASASRRWDRRWADRQASYRARVAAVRAHNARERQRYQAGMKETANSEGELVIKYTYRPRYQSYPARPRKPAALKVSVRSEAARLSKLRGRIDDLMGDIESEGSSAQSFGPVYQALANATKALGATVDGASRAARAAVVSKGAKGRIINASRISKVSKTALDAPFSELERSYSDTLTTLGLTAEQVAADSADTQ